MQLMRLMVRCCGMAVERMGMLGVNEKDEGINSEDGDGNTEWYR